MHIAAHYSHLNGFEWLKVHHPSYWNEIQDVVSSIDASTYKTKISKEKTMLGRTLYSPPELNRAFKAALRKHSWDSAPTRSFYVTSDPDLNNRIMHLPRDDQKAAILKAGHDPISTSNAADFRKGRVSLEIQFGKYSFVQFDLFIKHAADYMQGRIDLGIEIVPMKAMEREMSSGPPYYEKHLHEIQRQGRIFPPVPLILIGVAP